MTPHGFDSFKTQLQDILQQESDQKRKKNRPVEISTHQQQPQYIVDAFISSNLFKMGFGPKLVDVCFLFFLLFLFFVFCFLFFVFCFLFFVFGFWFFVFCFLLWSSY